MVIMQVLASKSKIYMVLEYVTGGELFDKIVRIFTHILIFKSPWIFFENVSDA